jgi:hypothetical protein
MHKNMLQLVTSSRPIIPFNFSAKCGLLNSLQVKHIYLYKYYISFKLSDSSSRLCVVMRTGRFYFQTYLSLCSLVFLTYWSCSFSSLCVSFVWTVSLARWLDNVLQTSDSAQQGTPDQRWAPQGINFAFVSIFAYSCMTGVHPLARKCWKWMAI